VVFNKDSSRVGPKEWVQIARLLDKNRCGADPGHKPLVELRCTLQAEPIRGTHCLSEL